MFITGKDQIRTDVTEDTVENDWKDAFFCSFQ
jgi:hypothetical protein